MSRAESGTPRFQLRLLGAVSLVAPDGRPLDDVVSSPRRLALLAYLAMHSSRGFIRRDTLLLLLWPELHQHRGRRALRQTTYVLRGLLSEQVLVSRGTEEIGIAREHLWCDVTAFEEAMADRDFAGALELYRGDLLEAFGLPDLPEFEQWRRKEQTRLRLAAADAAREGATSLERAGSLRDAANALERAIALAGSSDERAVQRLMALLDRAGDRASALRAYDSFAREMRAEHGVEPSAETRSLHGMIRSREGVQSDGMEALSPTNGAPLPAENVPRAGPTPRPLGRFARSALLRWTVGVVTGLIVALGTWYGTIARASAPTDHADRLAIFPFEVNGTRESIFLADALMDLLSTDLDGLGTLRTIDPAAVVAAVRSAGPAAAVDGEAIAQRLQARYYVRGRVVEARGRLRVAATLHERGRSEPVALSSREGTLEKLFELVDALAADLLVASHPVPNVRLRASAARTTHSLGALKAYLDGESAHRAGRHQDAFEAMKRAVTEDSTFALANYRMSVISDWSAWPLRPAEGAAERAQRHAARLSERDRMLIDAHVAYVNSSFADAEERYRAIVARYPDEIEAWSQLGEVLYHRAEWTDHANAAAREAFEHVLALDPFNRPALVHLARISAIERKLGELDSLYRTQVALGTPADSIFELRALRALVAGAEAREAFLRELRDAKSGEFERASWLATVHVEDLPTAMRIAKMASESGFDPDPRFGPRMRLGELHVLQGRIAAARREFLAVGDSAVALEFTAMLAVMPFRPAPMSELTQSRASLLRGTAHAVHSAGALPQFAAYGPWHAHLRLFFLGLVEVRLNDVAAARKRADLIEAIPAPIGPGAQEYARELAQSIRVQALAREGKVADALRMLEGVSLARPAHFRTFFSRHLDRFVRAELLVANGRERDAMAYYGSFDRDIGAMCFAAPSHYRLGGIRERAGDRSLAIAHYRNVLRLWSSPDPELAVVTTDAQERLRRLQQDSTATTLER